MTLRGIRGATSVAKNSKLEIVGATKELLAEIVKKNKLAIEDIASVLFSSTNGLDAEFPAVAARQMGWNFTALLCMREIDVPGSLQNCIRVLLLVNSEKKQSAMVNVYLRKAKNLRR